MCVCARARTHTHTNVYIHSLNRTNLLTSPELSSLLTSNPDIKQNKIKQRPCNLCSLVIPENNSSMLPESTYLTQKLQI